MHKLFIASIVTLAFVGTTSHALTLTTEEYPPFNMVDTKTKEPTGIAVDKVVELMHRAHVPYTITPYPWARAYQMALQTDDTCVFSTSRTPEREPLFTWIGPVAHSDWAIFAKADDKRRPKALEEMHAYTIGGYSNDATGEYLKLHGYKVDLAVNDSDNPLKLMNSHIDYWATGELLGKYLIGKAGLTGQIVPLFKFKLSELYVACNRSMNPQDIEKFNHILKDMDRDGTSEQIEKKYQ